ncbi:carbonate dehydratase NCE103 [Sugiyamaella lignohabitans]|uniref:Carbonic anhydrase n=1 Tax=Sugiyamaella lignohabitans TaxID=796027 RepID=A0A167EI12_9ASCO|nr:carbonate dehydratase NCE103 [Sugiyamaella lignohabitans]ANB14109.1 carbonate dehydratase NCE103 [Sugiyamaella lignohabitans]
MSFAPSDNIAKLLDGNKEWAAKLASSAPGVLEQNAKGQQPNILWFGCADSRAGESCLGLHPGQVFVHRNIANIVSHSDISSLSVLQLAVDSLKVSHIIVCGHYDCKGVEATLKKERMGGELDAWLRHLRDVRHTHAKTLDSIDDFKKRCQKLVELNVIAQVRNVRRNDRVMAAAKERGLKVYGLVYDVATGLVNEVPVPVDDGLDSDDSYLVH